jgi:tRNA modification GTPase
MASRQLELIAPATICALSTPKGRSALAIIRISGPEARAIAEELGGCRLPVRSPQLAKLKSKSGELLDEALLTYFQAPNSFTGEDLVEIHCHGNPIIVEQIIAEIVSCETRLAEPGEFSQRALAHGKMSLSELESMDWILNARSQRAVRRGLEAKLGGLGIKLEEFRSELTELIADIEAQLDFPEHEVGELSIDELAARFQGAESRLEAWLKAFERDRRYLDKWTVVIAGAPNSGKSSLMNALLGTDKSIVFDQPGTTRDLVEAESRIQEAELFLVDSAGLRSSDDPIESIGIKKTHEAIQRADLVCWVSETAEEPSPDIRSLNPKARWLMLRSKADLGGQSPRGWLETSVLEATGLDQLRSALSEMEDELPEAEAAPLSSRRQARVVEKARQSLSEARQKLLSGESLEWVAQSVLEASHHLEEILGEIPTEDLIRSILSRFCIGK